MLYRMYKKLALSESAANHLRISVLERLGQDVSPIESELCFMVEADNLSLDGLNLIQEILTEPGTDDLAFGVSHLRHHASIIEHGPRLNFPSVFSSTARKFFRRMGITEVSRMEYTIRYGLEVKLSAEEETIFLAGLFDTMAQMQYHDLISTFKSLVNPQPVRIIPFLEGGVEALLEINKSMKLGFDKHDIKVIADLCTMLKRNPTDVELFQLSQANSEHSRHHFFSGRHLVDGILMEESLMDIVKTAWKTNSNNSVIAFNDDSSAIRGFETLYYAPTNPGQPSPMQVMKRTLHFLLTAETHNYPSGISPFHGGATGLGGWLRDLFSTRNGSLIGIAGAGIQVGNLHIPGYPMPWETEDYVFLRNAKALYIAIETSNGVTDYGNCFGIPNGGGFFRTHPRQGKPIVYMGGMGQIDDRDLVKQEPKKGMLVVELGGPGFRVGIGGGSGSSLNPGENTAEADFNAVQRGDPFTQQPVWRVIRACVEMPKNPIVYMTDLGAGGLSNAVPEVIHPAGARIELRSIPVGDKTLASYEIWGNESQERCVLLVWPEQYETIATVAKYEGCEIAIIGQVTGDGYIILHDASDGTTPVNLPLNEILGNLPKKTFELVSVEKTLTPLILPDGLTVKEALERVLRFPATASKRWLTTKGDRSVTGLVAQQQHCGPNHLPISDYMVMAQSMFSLTGCAGSFGEQQPVGEISPEAMARMAITEAILQLGGARYTRPEDIRYSANWMLAAKEPGEGVWLIKAAKAMRDFSIAIGIACDGGKDSMSMLSDAINAMKEKLKIICAGQLVIAPYVPMEDITRKVTPDLKYAGSSLIWIDLSEGKKRLGGSALGQVFNQTGNECPDMQNAPLLLRTMWAQLQLLDEGLIESYHDIVGDGLLVCLLEMAFGGNLGLDIDIQDANETIPLLFSHEAGAVIETTHLQEVEDILKEAGIPYQYLGMGTADCQIHIWHNQELVLHEQMVELRDIWEEWSFEMDKIQSNPDCAIEEHEVIRDLVTMPKRLLTFDPQPTPAFAPTIYLKSRPRAAILRDEGSNGDRELGSAYELAGFEAVDVSVNHLLDGAISLDDNFSTLALCGGFSNRDVFGAGRAQATIMKRSIIMPQLARLKNDPGKLIFGTCNGSQIIPWLGIAPWTDMPAEKQPHFVRNNSGRFEARDTAVMIMPSPAYMTKGMEGSILGIDSAHGEGRFHTRDLATQQAILDQGLAPVRFVDHYGKITEQYPFNPNGSPHGIAGMCTPDGRTFFLMPHPERGVLPWQYSSWQPPTWRELNVGVWLYMFQNAYKHAIEHR